MQTMETHNITAGVPLCTVLGPFLWNIMYDFAFNFEVSEELNIVGFADIIAVVVQARHLEEVKIYVNKAVLSLKGG